MPIFMLNVGDADDQSAGVVARIHAHSPEDAVQRFKRSLGGSFKHVTNDDAIVLFEVYINHALVTPDLIDQDNTDECDRDECDRDDCVACVTPLIELRTTYAGQSLYCIDHRANYQMLCVICRKSDDNHTRSDHHFVESPQFGRPCGACAKPVDPNFHWAVDVPPNNYAPYCSPECAWKHDGSKWTRGDDNA